MPARIVALLPIEARRLTSGRHDRPVRVGLQAAVGVDGARVQIVGEHHAVADEHPVLDRHAFADEAVARDLAVAADRGAALDLDERADPRARADPAAIEVDQVGVMNDDVFVQNDTGGIDPSEIPCYSTSTQKRGSLKTKLASDAPEREMEASTDNRARLGTIQMEIITTGF